jgi:hypothetical protein
MTIRFSRAAVSFLVLGAFLPLLGACASLDQSETKPAAATEIAAEININQVAERYVRVALAFGEIDSHYVDAYTGPEKWREEALAANMSLEDMYAEAVSVLASLELATPAKGEEARLRQLQRNVTAMIGRMRMARGERLSFNDEAAILYDAIVPSYDVAEFDAALLELDALLPGSGDLARRLEAIRSQLYVPKDKIPAVMEAAIAECRARTQMRYDLPEGEKFDLAFVKDKPWSAYNWYQGEYRSLIEVNLDQPFAITRALDLGCHEGYPGHHVWNLYVESEFIHKNGWLEYQLFPLFAPGALFAEGSADYGVELAFPGESRLRFEQEVLYPIANIDPVASALNEEIDVAAKVLRFSRIHIARAFLDGEIDREQAIAMTMKYSMTTRSSAEQSLSFIDTYRAYVINYSLGKDLVRNYIEARSDNNEEAWQVFEDLLLTPTSASDLLVSPTQ